MSIDDHQGNQQNIIKDYNIEVRFSKSNDPIPVVNGVILHSLFDPKKEASKMINSMESDLINRRKFLVLGLGFSYHIDALINFLAKSSIDDFEIYVIEPNSNIVNSLKSSNVSLDPRVSVFSEDSIEAFYQEEKMISFLLNKPYVFSHAASFNLYEDFFKSFLRFRPSKEVGEIRKQVQSQDFTHYLEKFEPTSSLKDCFKFIKGKQRKIIHRNDYIMLALSELERGS